MTTELTTAYEKGTYNRVGIDPTAYATVPVKEFDWGVKSEELKQGLITGAIVTGVVITVTALAYAGPILGALSLSGLLEGVFAQYVFGGASASVGSYIISELINGKNGEEQ